MENAIAIGEKCYIRPYVLSDAPDLQREANNPKVARNLRNRFPNPYTLADAEDWIPRSLERKPLRNFAIFKKDGTFVGGIGLIPRDDIEERTMEIGYWLGEAHWGQGIATDALKALTKWSFETIPELRRLEGEPYEWNPASRRVLEKAGYTYEGTRRQAAFKDGQFVSIGMLGMLREECQYLEEEKN